MQDLYNLEYEKHLKCLDTLIEEACYNLEEYFTPHALESVTRADDMRYIVEDFVRDAASEADSYYRNVRELYQQSGTSLSTLAEAESFDPDRALWSVLKGFADTDFNGLTFRQVKNGNNRARMSMNDLWAKMPLNNLDDMQQFIADMMHTANRQMVRSIMKNDPDRPRWARVPRGFYTCAFCLMLASRGFKYRSQHSAGLELGSKGLENYYHEHCDCEVVPQWGAKELKLKGYDVEKYKAIWKDAKANATNPKDYRSVLKEIRKMPGVCKDGRQTIKHSKGSINIPNRVRVNSKEKRAMQWIAQSGHNITANPVKNIQNQKNPDFTIDKEIWELKTISGNSKNTIDNALKHASKQSANVILDITDSNMSRDLVNTIVQKRLSREDTKLNCVCIIENGKINYYKRAGHSPKPTP